jgi:hypothetical protein
MAWAGGAAGRGGRGGGAWRARRPRRRALRAARCALRVLRARAAPAPAAALPRPAPRRPQACEDAFLVHAGGPSDGVVLGVLDGVGGSRVRVRRRALRGEAGRRAGACACAARSPQRRAAQKPLPPFPDPGLPRQRRRVCGGAVGQRCGRAAAAVLGGPAAAGEFTVAARHAEGGTSSLAGALCLLQRNGAPCKRGRALLPGFRSNRADPGPRARAASPRPCHQTALRDGAAHTPLPGASTACLVALGPDCRSAAALNCGDSGHVLLRGGAAARVVLGACAAAGGGAVHAGSRQASRASIGHSPRPNPPPSRPARSGVDAAAPLERERPRGAVVHFGAPCCQLPPRTLPTLRPCVPRSLSSTVPAADPGRRRLQRGGAALG